MESIAMFMVGGDPTGRDATDQRGPFPTSTSEIWTELFFLSSR